MNFDWFSTKMPAFNMRGSQSISTHLGTALTFISAVVVIIYAIAKSTNISSVRGSTTSYYLHDSNSTPENPMDLSKTKFRIAFAFEGYNDKEFKNDPRYVRYIIRIQGKK